MTASSEDVGEFWEQEDEVQHERTKSILRQQAAAQLKEDDAACNPGNFIPTADSFDEVMDDIMLKTCEALETLDGGITLLHDMTTDQFGGRKNKKKKNKKKQKQLNVGVEEAHALREAEKEKVRRQEEKAAKRAARAEKERGFFYNPFATDPPAGDEEDEDSEIAQASMDQEEKESEEAEEEEEGEDLAALEAEIGHYIDMLQEHKDKEEGKRQERQPDGRSELLGLMSGLDKKQYLKSLESEEQLIWSSLDTNKMRRRRFINKKAPSPENILGRMQKGQIETEEAREARITRMLDALDRRMAAQAAARVGQKSRQIVERGEDEPDPYDDGLLFGLLDDFKVFGDLGGKVLENDCGINLSLLKGDPHKSLKEADEEFFKAVEDSKDPPVEMKNTGNKKKSDTTTDSNTATSALATLDEAGILADTRDALLDIPNVCVGTSTIQNALDAARSVNPATYAGTNATNGINSTDVVFNKAGDALEDDSVDNFDMDYGGSRDPPALSWFSFLNATTETPEEELNPMIVPDQIHLDDESREDGLEQQQQQQQPIEAKQVSSAAPKKSKRKGLKITAFLEDDTDGKGVSRKSIERADSTGTFDDLGDMIPCWTMEQQEQRRLTTE